MLNDLNTRRRRRFELTKYKRSNSLNFYEQLFIYYQLINRSKNLTYNNPIEYDNNPHNSSALIKCLCH